MSQYDSDSRSKKVITIVIVVLLALGFGVFLFKISPQDTAVTGSGYNAALEFTQQDPIKVPPPFDPSVDHYLGNKDAKNVFIEYGDMQCPACAGVSSVIKQVPTSFEDTVLVYRYFPLVNIHQNAVISAMAAEAAAAQGKYWEMHEVLFQKQQEWQSLGDPTETFVGYAQSVGVANIEQFKNDIVNKKYLDKIERDNNQAGALNLTGTPTLFFNGHIIQSKTDVNALKEQAKEFFVK